MEFIPFDATEEEAAERRVLRPGVPKGMRSRLTAWVHSVIQTGHGYVYPHEFHTLENNLDIDFNINPEFTGLMSESDSLKLLNVLEPRDLLRVADFLLFKNAAYSSKHSALESVLAEGRSMYQVVPRERSYRLAPRLPEGVQQAGERVAQTSETAGILLRKAWNKVYDLTPDDSGAYSAAVKAVEAAAFPVLGIAKELATVSDAIRAIEKRDANWRLPFKREHTEYPSKDVLLGMLKSLYRGQRDRHGSAAYEDVSHEEAEAAVLLAVTLVGWFSGSLVKERDPETFG